MNSPAKFAEPITDDEAAQIKATVEDSNHAQVAPIPSPPHTDAEYRAALHDPELPQPVKRAIKQHLYGAPGGRREVRTLFMRTHNVAPHAPSAELKRPAGVSARKWKKERIAVKRIVKVLKERGL